MFGAFAAGHRAAGQGTDTQEPATHWLRRSGLDWQRLSPEAKLAYVDGFLAGAALAQVADTAADSAGMTLALERLRRSGELRFPYAANVYLARLDDYYWWENHRPRPTWLAFWEVNRTVKQHSEGGAPRR